MRIGIDARFLTHPQVGGFKTYTENLINALSRVDDENHYVVYLDRPAEQNQLLDKENFEFRVVPGILPLIGMPIREQIQLRRQFVKDKLDIIHSLCNTAPVGIPDKLVITLHDTIQVTGSRQTEHTRGSAEYRQRLITLYSKWAIILSARNARRIITVSDYEKAQISKQLKIDPERICVAHLAPNPIFTQGSQENKNSWRLEMRTRFNLYDRYLLGVGYEPRKNIPLLIKVFSQIAPNQPDLGLVIVAARPEKKHYYRQVADDLNLDGRVTILDALPPRDLMVLFNLADTFVFPSERESFGLPIREAMACGTPVIAGNNSSIPEIVENAALLVDAKDAKAMENNISQILKDPDTRRKLISKGLKRASVFSWNRCALQTIDVYKEMALRRQPAKTVIERSSA
jgi:glycosyltransferase involved in cell wall biosynthesis